MEDQWLTWAKRLQAIASTGLHFSKDDFDRQRYRDVAAIAQSMLASLGNIPIKRSRSLRARDKDHRQALRASVASQART